MLVRLIFQLVPSDAPPESPLERDHALRVGLAVGKLIRKLNMIDDVFVVSSDPFKLLAVNHENSAIVTGWWFKKEFYVNTTIKRMRDEFIDLVGLRDCYIKTAPTGLEFAPFLYETGIVTKSVNGSVFDASLDILNNAAYFSGRAENTLNVLKKNYNSKMHYGAIVKFYQERMTLDKKTVSTKLDSLKNNGMDRIITDDPHTVSMMLTTVGSSATAVFSNHMVVLYSMVCFGLIVRYLS